MVLLFGFPLTTGGNDNKGMPGSGRLGIADVVVNAKVMRRVKSIGCMALLFGFPLTTGGNDNKGMPGSGRRWGDAPGRVNGGDTPGSGRTASALRTGQGM